MNTRAILLPESAAFPTANFPAFQQDTQGRMSLAFDASVAETCYWTFVAPQGMAGAWTAVVTYRAASATTGTFQFNMSIEAISDGDALDTDAASSFATTNTSSAATVPGVAGYINQVSLVLTNNDSIAIGDLCRLSLARNTADTAAGDIQVLAVELRDAA